MALKHPTQNPDLKKALADAQESASKGDCPGMLQGLFNCMLLEGYARYFKRKYPELDSEDISDIIGIGTDELCERVLKGEKIISIKSYLWKVIDRKLSVFNANKRLFNGPPVENLGTKDPTFSEEERPDDEDEQQRDALLTLVESLIPRLGLVNAQNVMKYLLGCIRNGVQDVTSTEIGEALGLTPVNVRQSMKRGFERLERICREEKLIDESHSFSFLKDIQYYSDESDEDSDDHEDSE